MFEFLRKTEKGQDLAEYALLIGLIALVVILAVTILGTNAGEWIDGTPDDDLILARGGNDIVYADAGNDTGCQCRVSGAGAGGRVVMMGIAERETLFE